MAETPSDLFGDLHIQLRRDMTGGNLIVDRDCTIKGNLTVEGEGGGGGGGGETDWSKMPTATTEKVGGIVVGNGLTVVVQGGVTPGKVVGQLDIDFAVPTVLPSQAVPGQYDYTDDAHAATPKAAYSIAYWTATQLINTKIKTVIDTEEPLGNEDIPNTGAVVDYVEEALEGSFEELGTAAGYDVGNAAGTIPVLDGAGKLSISMMPERVIGGEYLGEVADQAAMIAKSTATVGDFVKRTDTGTYWMLGINSDGAYATAANWFEYAGAVASVNGATGQVTQAQLGLETTLTTGSDVKFPSSKAVADYVAERISNLGLSTNYAAKNHIHTSANISDSISVGNNITSSATGLTQGKAVYEYVASQISSLNLANTYAPLTHYHNASAINEGTLASERLPNATASAKGAVIIGAGLSVSSGTVTLSAASTSSLGGVIIGSGLSVSSGTVSIAAATSSALGGVKVGTGNGLTFNSNKIEITLANGTSAGTVKQGNGVTISSGTISAKVDGVSVILDGSGQIGVDDNYVIQVFDNIGGLKETTARESYLKQAVTGITAWNNGTSYAIGDKVLNRGEIYRATAANQSKEPYAYYVGVTAVWEKITLDAANRFETVITGTGALKMFTVTHNLGVKDCDVTVIDDDTDDKVLTAVRYDSANTVIIGFAETVALNKKYRVVIRK